MVPVPEYPASHVTLTLCPVVPVMLPAVALLELTTLPVDIHVLGIHVGTDSISCSVYPVVHTKQMLALFVVQAVPVAAAPLEHEHTFWVHSRLDEEEQVDVSLVPVPQLDRHLVQVIPVL